MFFLVIYKNISYLDHVRQKINGSSPMLVLGVFGNNDTCVGKYKPAYFEITDTRFKDLNKFSCCVLLLYLNSFAGSKFWKYFVQWRRTYSNLIVVFFLLLINGISVCYI